MHKSSGVDDPDEARVAVYPLSCANWGGEEGVRQKGVNASQQEHNTDTPPTPPIDNRTAAVDADPLAADAQPASSPSAVAGGTRAPLLGRPARGQSRRGRGGCHCARCVGG